MRSQQLVCGYLVCSTSNTSTQTKQTLLLRGFFMTWQVIPSSAKLHQAESRPRQASELEYWGHQKLELQ